MKRLLFIAAMLLTSAATQAGTVPPPGSDTWYIASGDTGTCIAVPFDVTASTKQMWEKRGAPIQHHVLPSGGQSLTIFQGGDKVAMLYENESDCRAWLPIAVKMAREQRGL